LNQDGTQEVKTANNPFQTATSRSQLEDNAVSFKGIDTQKKKKYY